MAPIELREHEVAVGGRVLRLLVPADADALIDEDEFAVDEFLPYWAELWPAARVLAEELARRDLRGRRVLELGCGVGLPSVVAALGGADVLATDWAADALAVVRENAARNGAALEVLRVSWSEPDALAARGPFDLAVASDVLYEERNVAQLLALLPRLAPEALVVDPGRPALRAFLAGAERDWEVRADAPPELPRARIVRLSAARARAGRAPRAPGRPAG